MKKLENDIKNYFESQELSPDAIERMLAMGERATKQGDQDSQISGETSASKKFSNLTKRGLLVFAASFMMAVIIGQFYHFNKSTSELVLAEIAMNHNKRLDSEYIFNDFNQLKLAMQRLDFELLSPVNLSLKLIGGRYCSIQGNLAAQLKVKLDNSEGVRNFRRVF